MTISEQLLQSFIKECPKFAGALILLGLAWFVGQRLTAYWNGRQKEKEFDLVTARDFHDLYGEFFAIWKLWNYYHKESKGEVLPGISRWGLLERACKAEGKLESTLVRLTCEKSLEEIDIKTLGRFRQLYQELRETIRDGRPLDWNNSEDPDYLEFKTLAPKIAALIVGKPINNKSSIALIEITSNRHERA